MNWTFLLSTLVDLVVLVGLNWLWVLLCRQQGWSTSFGACLAVSSVAYLVTLRRDRGRTRGEP